MWATLTPKSAKKNPRRGGDFVASVKSTLAGAVFTGADLLLSSTEPLPPPWRVEMMARVNEVSMKIIAAQVVSLVRMLAPARGPKAVWLPSPPPKAPARSALAPLCSRTTAIRKRHTIT